MCTVYMVTTFQGACYAFSHMCHKHGLTWIVMSYGQCAAGLMLLDSSHWLGSLVNTLVHLYSLYLTLLRRNLLSTPSATGCMTCNEQRSVRLFAN